MHSSPKRAHNAIFCVMEEAGTYRKGHRDHNKMKSMITEGTMVQVGGARRRTISRDPSVEL